MDLSSKYITVKQPNYNIILRQRSSLFVASIEASGNSPHTSSRYHVTALSFFLPVARTLLNLTCLLIMLSLLILQSYVTIIFKLFQAIIITHFLYALKKFLDSTTGSLSTYKQKQKNLPKGWLLRFHKFHSQKFGLET